MEVDVAHLHFDGWRARASAHERHRRNGDNDQTHTAHDLDVAGCEPSGSARAAWKDAAWMQTAELNLPRILLQQLLECFTVHRLDQVRIESGPLGSGQVNLTTPARQRDDARTRPRPGVRTQALADLEPVDIRHAEVEQDDVRIEVLRKLNC